MRNAEDADAWARIYGGDGARRTAHREKTVDLGFATFRATGTAYALDTILRASGCRYREEAHGSAARWWRNGELEALETASRAEARALAQALVSEDARAPNGQAVPGTTVRKEFSLARAVDATDAAATSGAVIRANLSMACCRLQADLPHALAQKLEFRLRNLCFSEAPGGGEPGERNEARRAGRVGTHASSHSVTEPPSVTK